MRSVSFGIWVGGRLPGRDPAAVRRLALPGAPALQGHPAAHRAGDLGGHRGGRWRDERLHHQGVHVLLRAGARRRPAAGHRRRCATSSPTRCSPRPTSRPSAGVILEEIAMHDDEPGDEVHDLFAEALYGDHPLGRLISGTVETISPMTRRQIQTLLPAPLRRAVHRGRRRRQPRPRRRGAGRSGRRSPAPTGWPAGPSRCPGAATTGRAPRHASRPGRASGTRTPSRRTWCSAAPAHRPRRRAPVRPRRAQQRPRRRHVLAPVPGDPGAARPGVLGLLVHLPVRRHGRLRRLRRLRPGQGGRGPGA